MDEARAVLDRLSRIEALDRDAAPAGELLDELRGLLREAETWLRAEPDPHGMIKAPPAAGRHWTPNGGRDAPGCALLKPAIPVAQSGFSGTTESVQDSPVPGRTTGCVCALLQPFSRPPTERPSRRCARRGWSPPRGGPSDLTSREPRMILVRRPEGRHREAGLGAEPRSALSEEGLQGPHHRHGPAVGLTMSRSSTGSNPTGR